MRSIWRRRRPVGWAGLAAGVAMAVLAPATAPAGLPPGPGGGPVDGHYRGFGDQGGFRNVLPRGQDGSLDTVQAAQALAGNGLPPHVDDQYRLYHGLRDPLRVTDANLGSWFKDASFGVAPDDVGRVYTPVSGATVIRDRSWGVPHIFRVDPAGQVGAS